MMRVLLALFLSLVGAAHAADLPILGVLIRYSDGVMDASRVADLQRGLFGPGKSASRFWYENSYGEANVVGSVYPEILVSAYPKSSRRCHIYMAVEAKSLLEARGVDTSQYRAMVVVHSPNGCGEGRSNGYYATTDGNTNAYLLAHELGHALFGTGHAGWMSCRPGTNCTFASAGHPLDVMGGGFGSSNAAHRAIRGWYGGTYGPLSNVIQMVPSPDRVATHRAGTGVPVEYSIRPTSSWTGVVAVYLPVGDPVALVDESLWIEWRAIAGIDGSEAVMSWRLSEGALLTQTDRDFGTQHCRGCLIDAHPETIDKGDSAIRVGESYTYRGYTVSTVAMTREAITVRVTKQ